MIEYRVRKIERYEVTRYSETNSGAGVATVASNLTAQEADDIAGAMYTRAQHADMACRVVYSEGGSEVEANQVPHD